MGPQYLRLHGEGRIVFLIDAPRITGRNQRSRRVNGGVDPQDAHALGVGQTAEPVRHPGGDECPVAGAQ